MPGLSAVHRLFLLIALSFCSSPAGAGNEPASDIRVAVETRGDVVVIDAGLTVAASREEAWRVLIDFDHMSSFISNLQYSRVLSASAGSMVVEQKGKSSHGLFSFSFESTKAYELTPFEKIRTRQISGTFKKFEGTMELIADGDATRLIYHGESIPDAWIPPVVGPMLLKAEVQEQFGEMRAEILRRKQLAVEK